MLCTASVWPVMMTALFLLFLCYLSLHLSFLKFFIPPSFSIPLYLCPFLKSLSLIPFLPYFSFNSFFLHPFLHPSLSYLPRSWLLPSLPPVNPVFSCFLCYIFLSFFLSSLICLIFISFLPIVYLTLVWGSVRSSVFVETSNTWGFFVHMKCEDDKCVM